jgi:hypothetical protein
MNFIEARNLVRNLKIKSVKDWKNYHRCNLLSKIGISIHPNRQYRNIGWVDWYDWLGKSKDSRKYSVNDHFFKNESRNMYYIMGILYADGYLNDRNNNILLTQHVDDKYLLNNILMEMNSNSKIKKHYGNNVYFSITSKEIIEDLKKFGLHQSKSFTIKFPKINSEYVSDFIRGFFDGDGCITFQKNENCYVSSFASGSYKFINQLLEILRGKIDEFKGSISKIENSYVLNIGVNDTRRLGKYIYTNIEGVLYLKRKYEKFVLSGDIKVANFNKQFLSYQEAKKFIKSKGINGYREWRNYKKTNNIENIPSNPDKIYKEYKNWKNFIS